jgi:ketosteroid isomerase-like protein
MAMSQADIDTLRSGYEALNRRDWDGVFRAMHPDIEYRPPDRDPSGTGAIRGREETRRHFEEQWQAFEEVTFEPEEILEGEDRIVVLVRWRARPKGSSAVMENLIAHVWTMRGGKAARIENFPDRAKALEAAGLSG